MAEVTSLIRVNQIRAAFEPNQPFRRLLTGFLDSDVSQQEIEAAEAAFLVRSMRHCIYPEKASPTREIQTAQKEFRQSRAPLYFTPDIRLGITKDGKRGRLELSADTKNSAYAQTHNVLDSITADSIPIRQLGPERRKFYVDIDRIAGRAALALALEELTASLRHPSKRLSATPHGLVRQTVSVPMRNPTAK